MRERKWSWVCGVTPRQSVHPHNCQNTETVHLSRDEARVAMLRSAVGAGYCVPAVHGLTHHTWKQLRRYGTEFEGLPVERQCQILHTAKREVEELARGPVRVLIPPWNSFDATTVQAAGRVGLDILSGSVRSYYPTDTGVRLIPATVELIHLQQIMERGQRFPDGSVVVLLTHATDFVAVDQGIGYLREEQFGPLLDHAVQKLGMEVIAIDRVPDLEGMELANRVMRVSKLYSQYQSVAALPFFGERLQRWMLPIISALLPRAQGAWAHGLVWGVFAVWFLLIVAAASIPAALIGGLLATDPWRTGTAVVLALLGGLLVVYCGRNAVLKRIRGQWETQSIGLRTWTGMVGGGALVLSGVVSLVWRWMRA